MTKYSYMPTSDHTYILELGLKAEQFEGERRELTYTSVVDQVRIQPMRRLDPVPETEEGQSKSIARYSPRRIIPFSIISSGKTTPVRRFVTTKKRTIFWQVIDMRDSRCTRHEQLYGSPTMMSINQSSTTSKPSCMLWLPCLSSFPLASWQSWISREALPAESRAVGRDVDTIAGGDLDHWSLSRFRVWALQSCREDRISRARKIEGADQRV